MALDLGAAYQTGGFGQGFLEGFRTISEVNARKAELALRGRETAVREKQEAREEEIFQRGKNKAAYMANLHELQNASDDYQQGKPVDAVGILDRDEKLAKETGAPSIRQMLAPEFDQWHDLAWKAHQNPSIANSPEFIKAANWRYNGELNDNNGEKLDRPAQGIDAHTGQPITIPVGATSEHKEFSKFHLVPDSMGGSGHFVPDVAVHMSWKDKDGTLHHGVMQDPMTEGRSILASDDKIKAVNFNDFSNNTMAEAYLKKAIGDPSVRSNLEGMVLANGGTYDDLYPVLKGQDIKYIYTTSDGTHGVPKGAPVVQSVVFSKDGKPKVLGESDSRYVSQRLGGIYSNPSAGVLKLAEQQKLHEALVNQYGADRAGQIEQNRELLKTVLKSPVFSEMIKAGQFGPDVMGKPELLADRIVNSFINPLVNQYEPGAIPGQNGGNQPAPPGTLHNGWIKNRQGQWEGYDPANPEHQKLVNGINQPPPNQPPPAVKPQPQPAAQPPAKPAGLAPPATPPKVTTQVTPRVPYEVTPGVYQGATQQVTPGGFTSPDTPVAAPGSGLDIQNIPQKRLGTSG